MSASRILSPIDALSNVVSDFNQDQFVLLKKGQCKPSKEGKTIKGNIGIVLGGRDKFEAFTFDKYNATLTLFDENNDGKVDGVKLKLVDNDGTLEEFIFSSDQINSRENLISGINELYKYCL